MKKNILLVNIAFLFTCAVFAGFINPVLATCDTYYHWSTDGTAYSYVQGCFTSVGHPYYSEKHNGTITEGNVIRYAFTQFIGKDQSGQTVYDHEFKPLANNTGIVRLYYEDNLYRLWTITDSGYGTIPQSKATAVVGPPGSGP